MFRCQYIFRSRTRCATVLTSAGSACLASALTLGFIASASAQQTAAPAPDSARKILPLNDPPFLGKIGRTVDQSKPYFPPEPAAPKGAPNIVLIMTDDVGFGASSTFGGPVSTPTFDRVAAEGQRYNRFHTVGICSPTRAALLTGRNHHAVGGGLFPTMVTGFPGYSARLPKSAATLAEVLKLNGYNTAMFGKNHNTPDPELGPTGPFDRWPTGLGFEYFYGFNSYDANEYSPQLYENTLAVDAPTAPDYHLEADLADHAVNWIRAQKGAAPDKPFFVYYATGAAHAPHHAPPEWIERYRGQFDMGWDKIREMTFQRQKTMGVVPKNAKLTERPGSIPAWNSLSADQKRVYARMMEVYAASLSYADHQIGRVLDAVKAAGAADNTLVIYIQGDNGSSAEGGLQGTTNEQVTFSGPAESQDYLLSMIDKLGGPETYGHYPAGWAWGMDAPFQYYKQFVSHFGAIRNGMAASWRGHIAPGGRVASQFLHVNDVYPTLLEAAGLPAPETVNGIKQLPVDGVSFAYTFNRLDAESPKKIQYFELLGNRGIYYDGWFASTKPKRTPWELSGSPTENAADDYEWALYDLRNDFTQANDVARQFPGKLEELRAIWWKEAEVNQVLPIDDRFGDRKDSDAPSFNGDRKIFRYPRGMPRLQESIAPALGKHNFSISAQLAPSDASNDEGVIAAVGGRFGGWSFFLRDGRPVIHHALTQRQEHQLELAASEPLPKDSVKLTFNVAYDNGRAGGGAEVQILVDGKVVASGRFDRTIRVIGGAGQEAFEVGRDTGTPVADYESPFPSTRGFDELEVKLKE